MAQYIMAHLELPTLAQLDKTKPTKAQLLRWGVSWPPSKGWRKELKQRILESHELGTHGTSQTEQNVNLDKFFDLD